MLNRHPVSPRPYRQLSSVRLAYPYGRMPPRLRTCRADGDLVLRCGIVADAGTISRCWPLVYRLLRCLFGLPAVPVRSDLSKDVELLVLRHENQVLRRQAGGDRGGVIPTDSGLRRY
jgi:hypothetical protein